MASAVLSKLTCPSCDDYMVPPIRQCRNGHSICSDCISEEPNCPTCQKNFIKERNYALEAIANQVKIPCPLSSRGCYNYCQLVTMDDHVSCCDYSDRRCGIRSCKWTGREFSIMGHVRECHPTRILSSGDVIDIPKSWTSLSENIWGVYLQERFCKLFWVHIKLEGRNGKIMSSVQHIGSTCSKYEVKLENDDDVLISRMKTIPWYENMNDAFVSEHCFSVSTKLAKHFIDDEESILLNISIDSW